MDTVKYNTILEDIKVLEGSKKSKVFELRDILLEDNILSKPDIKRKILNDLRANEIDISEKYLTEILGPEYNLTNQNPHTERQKMRELAKKEELEEQSKVKTTTTGENIPENNIPTVQVTGENFNSVQFEPPQTTTTPNLGSDNDESIEEPELLNPAIEPLPHYRGDREIITQKDKEIADLMHEISTLKQENEQLEAKITELNKEIEQLKAQKPDPIPQKPTPIAPVTQNRAINSPFTSKNVHKEYLENRNRNIIKDKKL